MLTVQGSSLPTCVRGGEMTCELDLCLVVQFNRHEPSAVPRYPKDTVFATLSRFPLGSVTVGVRVSSRITSSNPGHETGDLAPVTGTLNRNGESRYIQKSGYQPAS